MEVIQKINVLGKDFNLYGSIEKPLFLAKSVAEWIDYEATSINKMLTNVDEDEKLLGKIFRGGQNRDAWFLTEDGLYKVLMLSRKPIAKDFYREVKKILEEIRSKKEPESIISPIEYRDIGESFEGNSVDCFEEDNTMWFKLSDIAVVLDADKSTASKWKTWADDDEVKLKKTQLGGHKTPYCSESMLYRILNRSNSPKAKPFERWVTKTVIPSIRKNGLYATDKIIDDIVNNPDLGIQLFTKLKEERQARLKAEQTNAILMHVKKTYTATEIAKELGMRSANELNKWLESEGIQYKVNDTWLPKADYAECGYFSIKQDVLDSGQVIYHRRITQLGRDFLLNLKKGIKHTYGQGV